MTSRATTISSCVSSRRSNTSFAWVKSSRPDLVAAAGSRGHASASRRPAAKDDSITEKVLEVVAGVTGYPPEMLELDLDLEADLGIDTVKQAETFAAVRDAYGIARDDNLELRDFPTLNHVIAWVKERLPEAAPSSPAEADEPATSAAASWRR